MSRFFTRHSDSETESDEQSCEEEEQIQEVIKEAYLSDSDDDVRVVRNEKDKREEELNKHVVQLQEHIESKSFDKATNVLDALIKSYNKGKLMFSRMDKNPEFFIKALGQLESFVNKHWDNKEVKEKLSKNSVKDLTCLRQKLRKYSEPFQSELAEYRKNPASFSDYKPPQEFDSQDEDDEDSKQAYSGSRKKSSSKHRDSESSDEDQDNLKTKSQGRQESKQNLVKSLLSEGSDVNPSLVLTKINEILWMRGKKLNDKETMSMFETLIKLVDERKLGDGLRIKLLVMIIPLKLDLSSTGVDEALRPEAFKFMLDRLKKLAQILVANPTCVFDGTVTQDEESIVAEPFKISGNAVLFLSLLNDEFVKILQNSDCYSSEYVDRLKFLTKLLEVCKILEDYYLSKKDMTNLCNVYLIHLDHIYYRMETSMLIKVSNQLSLKNLLPEISKSSEVSCENSVSDLDSGISLISKMCQVIYSHGHDRAKTRAILCHIYNLALNDRWIEARNMFLMSHLQDTIGQSDVSTQTLYNRTIVQLALCAFRKGMFREAFTGLKELQSSGRAKELLCQGVIVAKNNERNLKNEQLLRRQLLPFHMHLNLELIECVYLTCSILLEVPYMVSSEMSGRKKMVSRSLMYILRVSEKQPIVGPPETTRERLVSAAKCMQQADWKRCSELLLGIKVWNYFHNSDEVKRILLEKIKEESVKAYIFANRSLFSSISLPRLSSNFELSENQVRRIVNKCIMLDDLKASWDLQTQSLHLLPEQISGSLKICSMDLTDRITYFLELSDRVHDSKTSLCYLKDKVDHILKSLPEHLT